MNDFICWWYICNMKMKGQTKDKIEWFLNMLFTQMNLWIAWVQLDNEKKFEDKLIIEWLWSLRIIYETIVSYELKQNEMTERSNEFLTAKVRTMILNSKVSEILWLETVKTACYLLNWLSMSALKNNKISIQLLFKSFNKNRSANLIDLRHLQCFECIVYVYISKKIWMMRAKFESQSNKRILVEYKERNQYRV